jgi:hypothetical protein
MSALRGLIGLRECVDVVFFFPCLSAAAEWNALVWSIVVLVFFLCLGYFDAFVFSF